jgi:hypothetical protein
VPDLVESGPELPEDPATRRLEDWPEESRPVFGACFELLREVVPTAQPNYKQKFIGVTLHGQPNNFVVFFPQKSGFVKTKAYVADRDLWIGKLQQAGLEVSPGGEQEDTVAFKIRMSGVSAHRDLLKELFTAAYKDRG